MNTFDSVQDMGTSDKDKLQIWVTMEDGNIMNNLHGSI
jgi:hypothetical protein